MCGILGVIGQPCSPDLILRMSQKLNHRGPDSHGEWHKDDVWLAHRRLAILDISPQGHQPMVSPCGRYVITYNGEIYNYQTLRQELEQAGSRFCGQSDTEVLLTACAVWGVESAIVRFEGMFAFALYDRQTHCLWLGRDPMGIKPLYYTHSGNNFAFCSELTPLLALAWVDKTVDQDALHYYFRYRCIPAPASILRGVRKLPSASLLRFSNGSIAVDQYWNHQALAAGQYAEQHLSLAAAADQLESLLRDSVRHHMQSDVPYGVFLSGGVDSSTVTALMQAESSRPVKTFSIGFNESSHDESGYARAIANHLGTEHHELLLSADDIPEWVPTVSAFYDEPFADSSSIPTWLVSRFARESVKVCLSGDGGDELFGGYPRYFWAGRIEDLRRRLGDSGCWFAARVLQSIPKRMWDRVIDPLTGHRFSSSEGLSYRVHRMADYLTTTRASAYAQSMSVWEKPEILTGYSPKIALGVDEKRFPELSWANEMMLLDQMHYLQDEILTKVDRASMAVSLEARVPLLTHPIVEWSWKIADRVKLSQQGDRGKLVLREVLYRHVPKALIERPKQGFGMPLAKWLRGSLREWGESLLHQTDLEQCGLNPDIVHSMWREHQAGKDHQAKIWSVLMYRQWHQRVLGG